MATYLSPGVYVEEISSGSAPIAGVGTSTAAFIGVISGSIIIPTAPVIYKEEKITLPNYEEEITPNSTTEYTLNNYPKDYKLSNENNLWEVLVKGNKFPDEFRIQPPKNQQEEAKIIFTGTPPQEKFTIKYIKEKQTEFEWKNHPDDAQLLNTYEVWIDEKKIEDTSFKIHPPANQQEAKIIFQQSAPGKNFTIKYIVLANQITNELVANIKNGEINSKPLEFCLKHYPVNESSKTYNVKLNGNTTNGTQLKNDDVQSVARIIIPDSALNSGNLLKTITIDYQATFPKFTPIQPGEVKLCTNFKEFKKFFGDFSADPRQSVLAHAVYGFFNNGGTRCYVMRVANESEITESLLEKLEAFDEIAIVAAPGITSQAARNAIITHCQQKTGDRFAILDCGKDDEISDIDSKKPAHSNYAAFYFPWIQVLDPATKIMNPQGDGLIYVPPSGHIAGIYARVDTQRGVHKAPANETVLGALGLKQNISKNMQDGLNPKGINCIRKLNGNIRVWGARTIGGDQNGEFKYINVRRLFNYLKKSIDEGTQWTVFEPNSPELWAKIRRNVTAFLMTVWRSGALFGNTPEQAFYVKCDEETNPPELRDRGQVVTEIGVAMVKPAEFVIFHLSQWAGPGSK